MVVSIGYAIDQAWQHPDYNMVRKLGYRTVIRYVSHDPSKDLTPQELKEIRDAGLQVALVYETYETRPLSGYDGGNVDAREFIDRLIDLNMPPQTAGYYAVDFPPNSTQIQKVKEYARGWADVRGVALCGVYGTIDTIRALTEARLVRYRWQTSGNSRGIIAAGLNLYQYRYDVPVAGGRVDVNQIFTIDHGQVIWPKNGRKTTMPTSYGPLSFGNPDTDECSFPIPPVNDGALPWGPAWISVCADTKGRPFEFRVAIKGLTGNWNIITGGPSIESGRTALNSGDLWNKQLPSGTRMVSLWGPYNPDGSPAPFKLTACLEYGER